MGVEPSGPAGNRTQMPFRAGDFKSPVYASFTTGPNGPSVTRSACTPPSQRSIGGGYDPSWGTAAGHLREPVGSTPPRHLLVAPCGSCLAVCIWFGSNKNSAWPWLRRRRCRGCAGCAGVGHRLVVAGFRRPGGKRDDEAREVGGCARPRLDDALTLGSARSQRKVYADGRV